MEIVPSCLWHSFVPFYFSLLFVTAYGQSTTPTPTSYTNLTEVFPLLQGLQTPLSTRMAPGSQNFTQCCLLAVDESYSIQNGLPVLNQPNYVGNLPWYTLQDDQFPCGATWNNNNSGAPLVTVPYSWCKSNCGGWQRSHNAILTQWIQPFVGFILPSAVFCLNVPRKRSLKIPDKLFPNKLISLFSRDPNSQPDQSKNSTNAWPSLDCHPIDDILKYLHKTVSLAVGAAFDFSEAVTKAAIASTIALADTVLWVAIVFSMAAPMILSGLYEASVDRQILETIHKDVDPPDSTENGNNTSPTSNNAIETEKTAAASSKVKPMHEEKAQDEIVAEAYSNTKESPNTPPQHKKPRSLTEFSKKTKHRLHLLYAILIGNLELKEKLDLPADKLEQQETSDSTPDTVKSLNVWDDVKWLVNEHKDEIETTRMRLKSMLESQSSFGASVGAPVVFFLGSFLFSVFGNLQSLGDNDTSHSVAFGEWWMTIPHVAIVSGCLLAGNNPNIFEGIICNLRSMPKPEKSQGLWETVWEIIARRRKSTSPPQQLWKDADNIFINIYGPFYESQYQPVWMWNRGQNKQKWINRVQRLYNENPKKMKHPTLTGKLPLLNWIAWSYLVFFAVFLILGPFVLAYLTAYYTPTVGLSCRSFTFVLYFICQGWLSITWGWKFHNTYRRMEGEADEKTDHVDVALFISTGIGFCGAMLTTIAGTFMQIVGVYRNCKCMIPMNAWGSSSSPVVLSTNTAQQIDLAGRYWLKTSIASIVWLVVTCYVGWWYQRHWRSFFKTLVDHVLNAESLAQNDAEAHSFAKGHSNVEVKEVTE